jgi:hypothetical protein
MCCSVPMRSIYGMPAGCCNVAETNRTKIRNSFAAGARWHATGLAPRQHVKTPNTARSGPCPPVIVDFLPAMNGPQARPITIQLCASSGLHRSSNGIALFSDSFPTALGSYPCLIYVPAGCGRINTPPLLGIPPGMPNC